MLAASSQKASAHRYMDFFGCGAGYAMVQRGCTGFDMYMLHDYTWFILALQGFLCMLQILCVCFQYAGFGNESKFDK